MIRPASALQNGGLYPILTFSPAFSMISTMKTMFQGWFRAVSTGVCPYHQKSDFLSIDGKAIENNEASVCWDGGHWRFGNSSLAQRRCRCGVCRS